ncbi:MAG: pyridoxal-phosphate dependent enzyme [Solirubrobacterales bacterium]|nr:pyridoxal-phosphate dependent enzyme [Solirubrobacterales bacterium]
MPAAPLAELVPGTRTPSGPGGLWRYRACIPVGDDIAARLTLGEGHTPIVSAGSDLEGVALKLEFVFPTLSFKDRGEVVLIASAVERGARRVVADSSGNAGSAIAAYAARAGLECQVFVPAAISARKRAQILAYGASLECVAGDRTAAAEAAIAAVARTGATYASHIYNPYFLQGTKTFAFELWEQLGRGVPDAVIVPAGNGTLALGAARGFSELQAAGLIERVPALIALQSECCAPLAQAWTMGSREPVGVEVTPTSAEGIAIPRPARGAQILAAVAHSGGCVVSVPEVAIEPAQRDLAARGLFVEPTAALVWAGLLIARHHPAVRGIAVESEGWTVARALTRGNVAVPLCGSGLK